MEGYLHIPYQKLDIVNNNKRLAPPTTMGTVLFPSIKTDRKVKNCIHVKIASAKANPGLSSALIINGTRNRYLRAVDSRLILSNFELSNRSSKSRNSGSVKINPFL
mmetsp:Transcript_6382/g.7093  ORF Transcript_6382/g.7093 Transcript_6382/m.7093 type:complete len:106 (-) Transcript_6382:277-594(-)